VVLTTMDYGEVATGRSDDELEEVVEESNDPMSIYSCT